MQAQVNPARESLRQEQKAQKRAERAMGEDGALDKALEDTFPASDPVSVQSATKAGARKRA
jgi:hypothetical protein